MSRLKTLQRRNVILAGLIGVLLLVVVLRPGRTTALSDDALDKAFPTFEVDQARVIEIYPPVPAQTGEAQPAMVKPFVLAMSPNGQWVVRSQADYPIKPGAQERLLENVADMRVRKIVTTREETFEAYAGTGWVGVRILGTGEEELAVFEIGKAAKYPEHFVRMGMDDDQRIIQAVNMSPDMAEPDITRWVEPRLFPTLIGENVLRVDVEQPAFDRVISLGKKGALKGDIRMVVPKKDEGDKNETWWMSKPKVMDANSDRARDLVRSFTGVRFSGVASANPGAQEREAFGLAAPAAIVTVWHQSEVTKRVEIHKLVVGGKSEDGGSVYVQVGPGNWVFEVQPYQLSDVKRPPEDFERVPPPPPLGGGDGDDKDGASGSPDGDAAGSPDGDGPPGPVPPPAPVPEDDKPGKDDPDK